MPRDFLAFLNTFAWVMRWPSPSSPAVRALASSSATPKASPASTFCRNSATTAEWTRLVMVHLAVRQHRPEGIQADADIPRLRSARVPKSVPNGSYAKGLFGFFEHLRMGDALAFAE